MPTTTSHDGATVNYAVDGTGSRQVILLHGLGDDLTSWQPQVDALADTCRILRLDVRGHGRSQRTVADYSITSMARDVLAAAEAAGFDRAHVVGISMGGGVAFEVAILAPDLVESLVIVNSTPTARVGGWKGRLALGVRQLMARFLTPAKAAPTIAGRLFPEPDQQDLRDEFVQRLSDNDPDAYRESLNALVAFDRADESRSIQAPTLFVHSEHDYTPLPWRQPFVDAMPDATLVQVDGAHHAVTAEKPEEFNRILADHLAGVAGRTA